ncbi:transglutaminase domain-containing protein [Actinocrinis puniceicyclus]|uniref:Transglutaminase domain-containing protein n=1 Tax=Actinocrinis puniceicyclus TaxID=977794 RepID=A0A8J7WNV2_9ACTN|nr:transglutaminase-like domain-containing protein [Actinocrinis puniceicyclus]MBS2964728.1 transglutaminase domain-containing protein [Actinocrinis puniceicyclus]
MSTYPLSAKLRGAARTSQSATLADLRTTYIDWSYLAIGAIGIALGLALAYLTYALRASTLITALGTVLAYLLVGPALLDRADCVAGFAPSLPALRTVAAAAVSGWKELLTTTPPVTADGPLLAVPFILGLVAAALSLTLARRVRAAALPLAAPLLLLGGAIALGTRSHAPWSATGLATAVLCLSWSALRVRRVQPTAADGSRRHYKPIAAIVVLCIAAAMAALAGPLLPGSDPQNRAVLRDRVLPPLDLNKYPSPLVGYRKYTRDANELWDQTLFTVTGLPVGTPVRIATLDDYNGSVWGATNRAGAAAFLRVGSVITPDAADAVAAPGPTSTVRITIARAYASASDIDVWLPTAGSVTSISFTGADTRQLAADLRYNVASASGVVINGLPAATTFTLHTDLTAPTYSAAPPPYGPPDLTDGFGAQFASRAATWAKGASGLSAQLQAIATYLRTTGAYSDGGPGETQYLPGHSMFRLSGFLNGAQPVGDDEQYAAAYALAANSLGMPARVVLGAIPESDGVVQGKDVHAWVELHVAGGAWVTVPDTAFMPDSTKKPDQEPPQQVQDAAAAPVPPPNAAHPPTTDKETHATHVVPGPLPPGTGGSLAWLLNLLMRIVRFLSPILAAAAIYGAAYALKARRRHRRRTSGPPVSRYSAGWRELTDYARDLGVSVPEFGTRRVQALALAAYDLADLAWTADVMVFGPTDPTTHQAAAYWKRVDEARRAMARASRRHRRFLATLSLRSTLASRARPDAAEGGTP